MIDKDNKEELNLIARIVRRKNFARDPLIVDGIICESVREAISTSDNVDDAIRYVIITYPALLDFLKEVVKANYPNKLADLEKLAVLI